MATSTVEVKFTPLYGVHAEEPLSYFLEVDDVSASTFLCCLASWLPWRQ